MHLDWATIIQGIIIGAAVSWPGTAAIIWMSSRRTRQHVQKITDAQTQHVQKITDAQTRELLSRDEQLAQEIAQPEQDGHGKGV